MKGFLKSVTNGSTTKAKDSSKSAQDSTLGAMRPEVTPRADISLPSKKERRYSIYYIVLGSNVLLFHSLFTHTHTASPLLYCITFSSPLYYRLFTVSSSYRKSSFFRQSKNQVVKELPQLSETPMLKREVSLYSI